MVFYLAPAGGLSLPCGPAQKAGSSAGAERSSSSAPTEDSRPCRQPGSGNPIAEHDTEHARSQAVAILAHRFGGNSDHGVLPVVALVDEKLLLFLVLQLIQCGKSRLARRRWRLAKQ
jgi:hypothetical protein